MASDSIVVPAALRCEAKQAEAWRALSRRYRGALMLLTFEKGLLAEAVVRERGLMRVLRVLDAEDEQPQQQETLK